MNKPTFEILESDDNHIIFYLWQEIEGLTFYEKNLVINRFMTKESKIMEKAIERHLRGIFTKYGIIIPNNQESALNKAFDTLKRKNVEIVIVDRNKLAKDEEYIGKSDNQMTIINEHDYCISIAMEIKEINYEIRSGEKRLLVGNSDISH